MKVCIRGKIRLENTIKSLLEIEFKPQDLLLPYRCKFTQREGRQQRARGVGSQQAQSMYPWQCSLCREWSSPSSPSYTPLHQSSLTAVSSPTLPNTHQRHRHRHRQALPFTTCPTLRSCLHCSSECECKALTNWRGGRASKRHSGGADVTGACIPAQSNRMLLPSLPNPSIPLKPLRLRINTTRRRTKYRQDKEIQLSTVPSKIKILIERRWGSRSMD